MAIGVKVLERPIEGTSYVRATLKGLTSMKVPSAVAAKRGKTVEEILG